jgi:hypothetical protein
MKEIYDKIKIAFEESDIKVLPNPPIHINLAQYNFWSNNWGVLHYYLTLLPQTGSSLMPMM